MLERRSTCPATGKVHHKIEYELTDLSIIQEASSERLLKIVRSQWGIENGLRCRRNVTFYEDQPHIRHYP